MERFVSGKNIIDAILDALKSSDKADLAVAYWGKGATALLNLDRTMKSVRIICDLRSLCCNPDELRTLLTLGVTLKTKDGLHAKVYITSNKVIIGSANASTNGLGDDDDEENFDLEAVVVTSDEQITEDASAWFEKHWDTAELITKQMLDDIQPLWVFRNRSSPTLLRVLVEKPEALSGIPVRFVVFGERDKHDYDAAWNEIKSEYSDKEIERYSSYYPFYLDFEGKAKFKTDEYIVDYWATRTAKAPFQFKYSEVGGVWRVRKTRPIKLGNKVVKAILADLVKEVGFLKITDRDCKTMGYCVRDYLKSAKITERNILMDVPLNKLPIAYPSIFKSLKRRLSAPN